MPWFLRAIRQLPPAPRPGTLIPGGFISRGACLAPFIPRLCSWPCAWRCAHPRVLGQRAVTLKLFVTDGNPRFASLAAPGALPQQGSSLSGFHHSFFYIFIFFP